MIDMTEEQAREVQEDDRSIVKMEDFTSPDELYQELVQRVTKYHPSADISMIEKAYQVAKRPMTDKCVNPVSRISFTRFV